MCVKVAGVSGLGLGDDFFCHLLGMGEGGSILLT